MINRVRLALFLFIFLLPLAGIAIYELRFASDRYHSDSTIIITDQRVTAPSLDLSAIGLPAQGGAKDALVVTEFMGSIDMLQYLDAKLHLREHYSDSRIDWWTRLPTGDSLEDFHGYMSQYMTVAYDIDSEIIRLHVEAFDRDYARAIVNAILERSQVLIDRLNEKVATEQTKFFEQQLLKTEQRLRDVRSEMLKFQNENRLMSTEAQATLVGSNIADLEKALLAKQGELNIRLQELNEGSPQIQVLRGEIESIRSQLNQEKDRLSGGSSAAVAGLDSKFREIQFNVEFAGNIYKSNLAQLEQARVDAVQRLKYLVVVTPPTLADASIFPNHGFIIGTAAMILMMVFFILSLIIAIIREHA